MFRVSCQFLPDAKCGSNTFDSGNFSYGLLLGPTGSSDQFGLTIDPEITFDVRFSLLCLIAISVFLRNLIPLRVLQPIVINFNTGDEIKLEQSSLSSSNSTLFSVSLRTNLKVSRVSIWVFLLSHLGRKPNSPTGSCIRWSRVRSTQQCTFPLRSGVYP